MKRRVLLILLLLAGGAIVNIAVAWGCAAMNPVVRKWPHDRTFATSTGSPRWLGFRRSRFGLLRYVYQRDHFEPAPELPIDLAPAWSSANAAEEGSVSPTRDFIVEEATGWPLQTLWCEHIVHRIPGGHFHFIARVEGGIALDLGSQTPPPPGSFPIVSSIWSSEALPLRPFWIGFTINSVFYAAVLWAGCITLWNIFSFVANALARLQGRSRIKRGLCPKCAYPRGASEVCTECGAAHPAATVRH